MIKCRECGEEIRAEDIYCPYCGIYLKGITVAEEPFESKDNLVQAQEAVVGSSEEEPEKEFAADQRFEEKIATEFSSERVPEEDFSAERHSGQELVAKLSSEKVREVLDVAQAHEESEQKPLELEETIFDEVFEGKAQKQGGDFSQGSKEPTFFEHLPEEQIPKPSVSEISPSPSLVADTPEEGGKKTKARLKLLTEGTVLADRYEIIRKIGGGGMGAVYLAKDRNLGGVFRAVKEMIQSYIDEEKQEKAVNDFKREALLLSSLEHPSIPTIYDYFHDEKEGRFYLVMKYISGGDLLSRLKASPEGRLEEKQVTRWAIEIADVLDYLHNHQPPIIYRDLKPSNIMIDSKADKIVLVDFGIARWIRREEKGVTAVGTMGYAPPELFAGTADPRSDIYSLGATMFHLLTGADPQSNPLLIFDFSKNPRPRQINPMLSEQIEKIIMRAVEYKPEKRFSSAREMKEVLVEHLQNLETGKVTFGKSIFYAEEVPAAIKSVHCFKCGEKILETDVFCPFCGSKQQIQPKKVKARIYVISEEESVAIFEMEGESILIGRRDPLSKIYPDVDLTKYDLQTKISRRHARIWLANDRFMIEDLGSSNGTVLLRSTGEIERLLPRQPKLLNNGDEIKLGDTVLRFVIG
ncbi:MAG: protein kinase [Pyrinomonadaceae bacterium]|nr:protein kinase [Pyrinomonadaceae bacterium]MCX7639709.1 protein kinase [Pyrinomonadaceae bacterium]MDW8304611.1 protein kinase [Acidobacteriota bacterium]